MNRSIKGLLWASAIILLLFLMAEGVGGYMNLIRVQQLQQELEHLRIQVNEGEVPRYYVHESHLLL